MCAHNYWIIGSAITDVGVFVLIYNITLFLKNAQILLSFYCQDSVLIVPMYFILGSVHGKGMLGV